MKCQLIRTAPRIANVILLLAFLPAFVSCGEKAADPSASALPPGIELPRVGTLTETPVGEGVICVLVDGDGRITLDGQGPLSLLALREQLRLRTVDTAWREADRSSSKTLLLQADATVPWGVAQWILQAAADPTVGLYRIEFGARPWEGLGHGALGVHLPKDRGLQVTAQFVEELPVVTVMLSARDDLEIDADPERLYEAIRARWARMGNDPAVRLEIKAPPPHGLGVPTGFVVRVIDVANRVGIHDVLFEGAAPPRFASVDDVGPLLAHVAEIKARGGKVRIRLGDTEAFKGRPGADPLPLTNAEGIVPRVRIASVERIAEGDLDEIEEKPEEAPATGIPVPKPLVHDERVIRDQEVADAVEFDNALPAEQGAKEERIPDAPLQGPSRNRRIGLGGGAGGAFRGRGGPRDVDPSAAKAEESAVEEALKWLAAHQSPNGGWEAATFMDWCNGEPAATGPDGAGRSHYDPGVTGLAVCAFLGAGYTNRGRHPFAKTVSRGLRYLKDNQDAEGCFGPRTTQQYIYNHAVAALAMVQAYGMTGSPLFKGSTQKALDFIAQSRNPYVAWRYGVRPGDNDTSVTGWMAMTLASARLINEVATHRGKPAPLMIDEAAFDGIRAWIGKMTDPDTGRTGYVQRGGAPYRQGELLDRFPGDKSESLTAVGVLARILSGEEPRTSEIIQKGVRLCAALPPKWSPDDGRVDMVYWFWGSHALYQVGGMPWKTWSAALTRALLENQHREGTVCGARGSWDPIGPWGAEGGRVYATAVLTMCLVAPRLYERYGRLR